ncbi:hypothetical protein B446_34255 [Streptomyces collinus Tu 365]|uniref:Uncharacterized protein n=1 Tax=Streptomyces collinus (strain DSM 40733 / Tue 365) TaxID=1214242 RepID=S5UMN0_STRC3|nr:hypothetical protein B446_01040 [Streptomyces collinus Tu 365]AGS73649.1 hypothetical protein B446_34255 [Streptomyces collinus Tu 365]
MLLRAGAPARMTAARAYMLTRDGRAVYAGVPLASALGVGGASALACRRRSGFDTMATVVAATTLLMAGVSVYKLLPRRCPSSFPTALSGPTAPGRLTPRRPDQQDLVQASAEVH